MTRIFCDALKEFPPEKVVEAIGQWLTKSSEFPTPHDIKKMLAPEPVFDGSVYRDIADKRKRGDVLSWREEEYLKAYRDNMMKGL